MTRTDTVVVPNHLDRHPDKRRLVSHFIHKMRINNARPYPSSKQIDAIVAGDYPTPMEQLDNLVVFIGNNCKGPGHTIPVEPNGHSTLIGTKTPDGLIFVVQSALSLNLVDGPVTMGGHAHLKLTLRGWQRFEELKRGAPSGTRAFMAMKFGDIELDAMLEKHFKPAVLQTGFTLQTVGDNRKAGLIDDKIRVDIRAARFLVADLTHHNNGAYWEAGYAEGLGKPVIYTCRADVFDNEKTRPHFDTNHHLTVKWNAATPEQAVEDLKATIRQTCPDAKQID
ncbi:MAG: hypothetical protein KDE14_06895 [Rhodobacteraceae bacterium]|nr:hypothetical protein [Paracoccaceae bacterium]